MSTFKISSFSFKPMLLAAGLGLAAVGGAFAAGTTGAAPSGDGPRHDPAARMAKYLSLDETQKTNVSAIFERNRPANEALRERSKANREALRALKPGTPDYSTRSQALADAAGTLERDRVLQRTQMNAEFATVLTPEQLAKMQAHDARGGRHHGGRGRGPGPGGKPAPDAES
ncbi:Spy/CpxP family protein refolding chaperone [Panacagrimonas perspica]|uniref:Spy/CpxP family protein refolding chaperone n=1 Tax=Panacagrimonas perspica TaxID=381431 RepID=A0A4S3K1J8_9GAMM|nr:Spy/CpxP family protein refolding chaperone [Panacagrimonas perspica]TDU31040.1 Spy/CpxP family protein refolding chaperone [Panacagrimonas perspica]THD01813.1 hypothetical protein B1810_17575 [Panacagrimonas perspica]